MAEKFKGLTVEIGGDTSKLSKALKDSKYNTIPLQKALSQVNRSLKFDPTNVELIRTKQKLLTEEIGKTENKLQLLNGVFEKMNLDENVDRTSNAYIELQTEISKTEGRLKSLKKQQSGLSAETEAFAQKLEQMGNKSVETGKKFLPLTTSIAGIGAVALKTTADFDSAMSQVKAISGATANEFNALRDKAREMGAKTKFSAEEAAQAMNYMAMAGWDAKQMLEGIDGVMNLAAASGEDLATTSDIVTDALTAFGLKAKDSNHFADLLAQTSASANTNVSMMGETFKYVAPVAGSFGFTAEDTALAIGLMANAGIKSSQAGTALRGALTHMIKPSKSTAEAMDDLKISLTDSNGKMKSMDQIMLMLKDKFSGLTKAEKGHYAAQIFGTNAMSGMLAIINSSQKDYDKLKSQIMNCDGAAEKMADTMNDNLKGQLTILKSQLQELAISFGDILMPIIRKFVSYIQNAINWLNNLDNGSKRIITTTALLVASIGPVLIILGKLMTLVASAIKTFGKLKLLLSTVFAGVPGPVGIAVAAISGLIAVAGLLQIAEGDTRSQVDQLTDSIDKQTESLKKQHKETENAMIKATQQTNVLTSYKNQLDAIVDSDGNVQKGMKERAAFLSGELAQATGIDIKLVGGQIQNYNNLSKAIDETIKKMRAQAILEAKKEEYNKALENEEKLYKKKLEAEKQQADMEKLIKDQMAQAIKEGNKDRINALQDYLNQQQDNVNKANKNYMDCLNTQRSFEQATMDVQKGNYDNVNDILNKNSWTYQKTTKEKITALTNERQKTEAELNALKELQKTHDDEVTRNKIQEAQKRLETQNENLNDLRLSVYDAIPEYATALQKLSADGVQVFNENGKLSEVAQMKMIEVYSKINNLSPKYSNELKKMAANGEEVFDSNGNLTKAAKKKVDEANKAIEEKEKSHKNVWQEIANQAIEGYKMADFYNVGENAVKGITKGANDSKSLVIKSFKDLARFALDIYNQTLDINSPSREFENSSLNTILGIEKGVIKNKNKVKNVYSQLGESALGSYDVALKSSKMKNVISTHTNNPLNLTTNFYIENNSQELTEETMKKLGKTFVDYVDEEMYKRSAH